MTNYKDLENKFEFSPRIQKVYDEILPRVFDNRSREDTATSTLPAPDREPFLEVFAENPDDSYVVNLAGAIVRSWLIAPVVILKNEAIVGVVRPAYHFREHFSWGIHGMYNAHKREGLTDAEHNAIDRMEPLGYAHFTAEAERIFGKEGWNVFYDDHMYGSGYQGHTVPNYVTLLENGLDGMLEKIDKYVAINDRDKETRDFYEACRIIVKGMSQWLLGYSEEAARLVETETDEVQKGYYKAIAENCAFVAHKKPETLYQAVQLMWCLSLWDWVDCVGRSDQYLYPYYLKSVRDGDVVAPEDSIASIMLRVWENGAHNITVGGVDPVTGADSANELTYMMLQILRTIHDTHPRMSVRVHNDTPHELLSLVIQMWAEGMSDPSVVSDVNVIPGLVKLGATLEDARNYTILGCQEIEVPGKSNTGCEDGVFSLAKLLEYTMHNGRNVKRPEMRFGPETGEFVDFETFEDFFNAFKIQLEYHTKYFCHLCNVSQEIRGANHSKLVKGVFTDGCIEKGISHDMGGPIYNHGVIETAGSAAVADSLTAIKKLVFEEKKISKQTLMDALAANFNGYEKERQMLLNMAPKFGNDNEEADEMAARVLDLFWSEIAKYKSVRGGVFTGACSLLGGGISLGKRTGALPDGRFAGEPLGNSIGPRPGADKSGVSAMLASVAKLPLEKGVGGSTLNVVLTQKLLSNPALRESISATMRSYLLNGGQMAQITTANLEDLRDAQEHPERHGNLIVRIGGFSIQFVQLSRDAQNEIISRYSGESA
ncbi:MAG: hypothetical protein IKV54_03970 [Clostridia bacterium]|nr:hypothetical protein [Clostridia bacterium]